MTPDPTTTFFTDEQVSQLIGKSTITLRRWRREGQGPAFVQIGSSVRYLLNDVLVWALQNRVAPANLSQPSEG